MPETFIPLQNGTIVYQGNLRSSLVVNAEQYGKNLAMTMNVTNPYNPVEYQATITTRCRVEKFDKRYTVLRTRLILDTTPVDNPYEFACSMLVPQYHANRMVLRGKLRLKEPSPESFYLFRKRPCRLYYEPSFIEEDLCTASMYVLQTAYEQIYCDCEIEEDEYDKELLDASMYVPNIMVNKLIVSGTCQISSRIQRYKLFDLPIEFYYYKEPYGEDIFNMKMEVKKRDLTLDYPCRMRVKLCQSIYSMFSRMTVVNGTYYSIDCSMEVSNPFITDIEGYVFIDYEKTEENLPGELFVPNYVFEYLRGEVVIPTAGIYEDILFAEMLVASIVRADFDCSMNIYTPWTGIVKDFLARMRVGNEVTELFDCSMVVDGMIDTSVDLFNASMYVSNAMYPARIGILVDPLWKAEPSVLKSSLITFFDRVCSTNDVSLVFGGTDRTNWDIHKLAHVYNIPDERLIELFIEYDNMHPMCNRHNAERFLQALCMFRPYERQEISKVFVFTDIQPNRHSSLLTPIYHFCAKYGIQCVVISSDGSFVDTGRVFSQYCCNLQDDNFGMLNINELYHHNHHQICCNVDENTKHKNVFDDRPII